MAEVDTYSELLDKARNGDYNAYNTLCTVFLNHVPAIIDKYKHYIKRYNIRVEDLHQEGYAAVCEALYQLRFSRRKYTDKAFQDYITSNIIKSIQRFMQVHANIHDHETSFDGGNFIMSTDTIRYVVDELQYDQIRSKLLSEYYRCRPFVLHHRSSDDKKYNREKVLIECRILPKDMNNRMSLYDIAQECNSSIFRIRKDEYRFTQLLCSIIADAYNVSLDSLLQKH